MSGAGLALGALSCAAVVSFDDYSPRAAPPEAPKRYFVRGNVTGLEDAAVDVSFTSDFLAERSTLQNGPFMFPRPGPDAGVLDGNQFQLSVSPQPTRRFCALGQSFGYIDGGDVGIDIACSRAEPELTGLTFLLCEKEPADGAPCALTDVLATPPFASGYRKYSIRAHLNCDSHHLCLSLIATAAHAETRMTVRGMRLSSGRKQDLVLNQASVADRTIEISVTAPDGETTATYVVDVGYLEAVP